MRERILLSVLGILVAAPFVSAQGVLNLRDDGIAFPDGSLQTTAAQSGMKSYYLTQSVWDGATALIACSEGYRMASSWEIHDPSSHRYAVDHPDAFTREQSGSGPPGNSAGWLSQANDCQVWTSNSSGESGRTGALARVEPYNWWAFYGTACDQLKPVWCIELDRTLEDPGAPTALLVNGVSYPDGTVQTTASQGGMRSYYFTDGWAYWGDSACASGYHAATIWEILDPSNLRYAFEVPGAANYGEPEKGVRIPSIRVSTGSKGSGQSIGVLCGDGSGKTTRADPRRSRGGSSICGYGLGTYQWWDLNSWCLEVVNCSDGGHAPCISD